MKLLLLAKLLRGDGRHIRAVLVVSAATSILLTISASGLVTTSSSAGRIGGALRSFATPSAVLILICAIFALTSVSRLAVESNREQYRSWRIAGLVPNQIFALVVTQFSVLAAVGATAGAPIGVALAQPAFDLVFETTSVHRAPALSTSAAAPLVSLLLVVAVMATTVVRRAWRISRATRWDQALPRTSIGGFVTRHLGGIVALVAATSASIATVNVSGDSLSSTIEVLVPVALLSACASAVFVGVNARSVLPWAIVAWTALVPGRVSRAWYLARHRARATSERSAAVVAPGVIAATMCGSLYSIFMTIEGSFVRAGLLPEGNTLINTAAIASLLAAPTALAGVAVACSMHLAAGRQSAEYTSLIDSGARPALIVRTAVFEVLISSLTVFIVTSILVATVATSTALALDRWIEDSQPQIAWWELTVPTVLFAVIQASIILPSAARALHGAVQSRRPVRPHRSS